METGPSDRYRDGRYRPSCAHALAYQRASRPKPAKLLHNPVLRQRVQQDLAKRYSPEQIAGAGCGWSFSTTRRCRSRSRRSTNRCSYPHVAGCTVI